MEKSIKAIASTLGILATLATLVMMVSIAIDVFFRLLYDRSVPGVLEISETALVTAVFLGLSYTGVTNSHIAVDLLTERLSKPVLRWVLAAAWTLSTAFLLWILWATLTRAISSLAYGETRMGLVAWPIWPARWIIVIGLAAMLLVSIANLARTIMGNEVLGAESIERMPDSPERPYEYVTGVPMAARRPFESSTAVGDVEAARLANQEGALTDDGKEDR